MAVLAFLESTRVGCISTRRKVPEKTAKAEDVVEAGSGDEGEEEGGSPTRSVVSFIFLKGTRETACLSFVSFLCLSFFPFVWLIRE